MEELKKFQSSTFDTIARRRLVKDQDTILELSGRVEELQNEDRSVRPEGTEASPGARRSASATCARVDRERKSFVAIAGSCLGTRSNNSNPATGAARLVTQTRVQHLQQMMNRLQEERDTLAEELHGPVERPRVRQRVSLSHIPDVVPPMPTLDPHDSSNQTCRIGGQSCRRR